ncbi:MAG: tetratricopeptide repeat protein [Oscillospiraceae bacterium]
MFIAPIVFICAVVAGLVLLIFMMLDWQQDRVMIIYSLLVMLGVILGSCGIGIVRCTLGEKLKSRRAALKAMGRHAVSAIQKDKTARIAYKGIVKLMDNKIAEAEGLIMQAYNLSDVRNNQLFCIEWLVRIYEVLENSATAAYDVRGKLMWCYRRAAELAPDNPEAQSRLGHAYYVDGKLDKAKYCFEQAIKYDPNHGYSYYSIAKIHICRGEDEKAVEMLEQLLKIQENHPLVYSELATVYAMHREDEKCREYYEKAILCGYEQPEKLAARMTAIYTFNNSDSADGSDLPSEYYRHIQKEDDEDDKASAE